jgi:hypothetical protein
MNLARFFEHWSITENPFRGEEARQDPVFLRLGERRAWTDAPAVPAPQVAVVVTASAVGAPVIAGGSGGNNGETSIAPPSAAPEAAAPVPAPDRRPPARAANLGRTAHSDFEKIAGDFHRPSTAIVFGEKGSGKTAIRMQLAERIAEHNAEHPEARCLLVAYDDLNPILDRFYERMPPDKKAGTAGIIEVFRKFRLVDHIDAIISIIVQRVVSELFRDHASTEPTDLGPEPRRSARRLDITARYDLLLLEAVYDRSEHAEVRTRRLRRLLRVPMPGPMALWGAAATWGWILPLAFVAWALFIAPKKGVLGGDTLATGTAALLTGLYLIALVKYVLWDRLGLLRLGRRVRKQVRISARGDRSFAHALRDVPAAVRDPSVLPVTGSDEPRYAMLERLRRFLRHFGYHSTVIVIDRVDEPTLISGDPERMQAVVWPLLNNKFLQQPGLGVKMLLPIELRHALFRESAAFFQEARLDKQNLIERLTWTGAMLYDLCDARLQACRPAEAPPITLLDLFAEDVTTQDLVDALDQMHQPRDAFKLLYQCLNEHCSNVTESQAQWRIPRLVLDNVRKDQSERVRQLERGVRPA